MANVDLPSLRNIQRCQHIIDRMAEKGDRVRLLVNRYQPDNDITLDDVEHALGTEVYWTLPNDYDAVIYAINTGHPVILNHKSLYSRELEALGAKITGLPGAVPGRSGGLARRLLDRVKGLMGTETAEHRGLMLPPAVAGGESA